MRTLPSDISKLVTEHPQEIRDALRKLREDAEPVTLPLPGKKKIVIARLAPTTPAK